MTDMLLHREWRIGLHMARATRISKCSRSLESFSPNGNNPRYFHIERQAALLWTSIQFTRVLNMRLLFLSSETVCPSSYTQKHWLILCHYSVGNLHSNSVWNPQIRSVPSNLMFVLCLGSLLPFSDDLFSSPHAWWVSVLRSPPWLLHPSTED